ncbi:hypothetical protein [Halalkalibacter urbisdiaboli]|uniref:hypothetical protein n=1 Tax=Halalkalibacter urbisdiaboli TaxID=1960589 RepID=UPI000B438A51|nr:hypothetical protein [Halalkalibacter urbisdiaboli]
MSSYRTIDSTIDGVIEKVLIREGMFVHEWEPLFLIRTMNGSQQKIEIGVSGEIGIVKVLEGEPVCLNMTLAILKEDTLPTGCD